jgi:hypothetical protein
MAMNPRLLVPRATFDPDAARYLAAVEAADGQALETPVKRAVDAFFRDLKSAGIFDAIKASCILCGARTLSGALVPLAGTAPTNNNFIPDDYNRETGLVGNGSTKYLDSSRNQISDPQDNMHLSVYVTTNSGSGVLLGARAESTFGFGDSHLGIVDAVDFPFRSRNDAFTATERGTRGTTASTGLLAVARQLGSSCISRVSGSNETINIGSTTALSGEYGVFARIRTVTSTVDAYTASRIAFYSIGEALGLEALDDAVSTLVTAIGAAV